MYSNWYKGYRYDLELNSHLKFHQHLMGRACVCAHYTHTATVAPIAPCGFRLHHHSNPGNMRVVICRVWLHSPTAAIMYQFSPRRRGRGRRRRCKVRRKRLRERHGLRNREEDIFDIVVIYSFILISLGPMFPHTLTFVWLNNIWCQDFLWMCFSLHFYTLHTTCPEVWEVSATNLKQGAKTLERNEVETCYWYERDMGESGFACWLSDVHDMRVHLIYQVYYL